MKIAFLAVFTLWWIVLALFYIFPGIDITASRYFFVPSDCASDAPLGAICGGFPNSKIKALELLRGFYFYLPIALGITVIYRLIMVWSHHGKTYDKALAQRLMAGLVSLILGPGLVVNAILKEISHRPRPRNTDFFGGDLSFVPAGDFMGACGSNCSFISGEAAGAGWIFCYAIFLVPEKYRPALTPVLIAVSFTMAIMRLAYGGHYLSDIILAWLLPMVIFTGVLYLFTKYESKQTI